MSKLIEALDEDTQFCFERLVDKKDVHVTTGSRVFAGKVYEVGRSPFTEDFTARVVDDEGRVHYFRPNRYDAKVRLL